MRCLQNEWRATLHDFQTQTCTTTGPPVFVRWHNYNQLQEPRRWAPVNYFCHSSLPSALFGYEKKITLNCSLLPPRQITKPNALETPSTHAPAMTLVKTWWELSWHSNEVIAIISTKREYTWISAVKPLLQVEPFSWNLCATALRNMFQ